MRTYLDECIYSLLHNDRQPLFDYVVEFVASRLRSLILFQFKSTRLSSVSTSSFYQSYNSRKNKTDISLRLSRMAACLCRSPAYRETVKEVMFALHSSLLRCLAQEHATSSRICSTTTSVESYQTEVLGPNFGNLTVQIARLSKRSLAVKKKLEALRVILATPIELITAECDYSVLTKIIEDYLAIPDLTDCILRLVVKVFNSNDTDLVSNTYSTFMKAATVAFHSTISKALKRKTAVVLFKMINVCPQLWEKYCDELIVKMASSTIHILNSYDNKCESVLLLYSLAALDPYANWIRSWTHSYRFRRLLRTDLVVFLETVIDWLATQFSRSDPNDKVSFLDYTPIELQFLLSHFLTSTLFIHLRYPDIVSSLDVNKTTTIICKLFKYMLQNRNSDEVKNRKLSQYIEKLFVEVCASECSLPFLCNSQVSSLLLNNQSKIAPRSLLSAIRIFIKNDNGDFNGNCKSDDS